MMHVINPRQHFFKESCVHWHTIRAPEASGISIHSAVGKSNIRTTRNQATPYAALLIHRITRT